MNDYKDEIARTRVGCLGSSDGQMLYQISKLGYVPKSAEKRLAIVKGFIENKEIPTNDAIRAGDELEMIVYEHLKSTDARYESNPLWVSKSLSRKNVMLISHPDLVLKDENKKTIFIYEVKTTKYNITQTRETYKAQLCIHYTIGSEIAKTLGKGWGVKLFLVHYDTNNMDLSQGIVFEKDRLTIQAINHSTVNFDIKKAMDVVDAFLDGFTEYYEGDEVDAELLPEKVKEQFGAITTLLSEIKDMERKVEEFKKRLYEFMVDKDIKSIKGVDFNMTRVDPSVSKTFDYKRFIDDYKKEHPRKANKMLKEYEKVVNKRGYATIKLK